MKRRSLIFATLLSLIIPAMSEEPKIYTIPLKDIDGKETNLKAFSGKVILAVNVASKCGNTPQYKGLQDLYAKYKDKGLVVIGFPCNDFGAQEAGSPLEIKEFCSATYKVTFPMMDKIHVKGAEQHPLYTELSGKEAKFPGDVKWNFGKFLISRDGSVAARFEPKTQPESDDVVKQIEAELAKK